jgi:hypothetical protein
MFLALKSRESAKRPNNSICYDFVAEMGRRYSLARAPNEQTPFVTESKLSFASADVPQTSAAVTLLTE